MSVLMTVTTLAELTPYDLALIFAATAFSIACLGLWLRLRYERQRARQELAGNQLASIGKGWDAVAPELAAITQSLGQGLITALIAYISLLSQVANAYRMAQQWPAALSSYKKLLEEGCIHVARPEIGDTERAAIAQLVNIALPHYLDVTVIMQVRDDSLSFLEKLSSKLPVDTSSPATASIKSGLQTAMRKLRNTDK